MTNVTSLLSRLGNFACCQDGVSAVEFAVVLPFMLTLYLGGVELGEGIALTRKVAITSRTVTDLATQYVTIHDTDMNAILGASSAVIQPYSASNLVVTVSEVTTDAKGKATVTWSDSLNGTKRPIGQVVTLPAALGTTDNVSLIWGEVSYAYTPNLGYVVTGTLTLTDQIFMYPRLSSSVARTSP